MLRKEERECVCEWEEKDSFDFWGAVSDYLKQSMPECRGENSNKNKFEEVEETKNKSKKDKKKKKENMKKKKKWERARALAFTTLMNQ